MLEITVGIVSACGRDFPIVIPFCSSEYDNKKISIYFLSGRTLKRCSNLIYKIIGILEFGIKILSTIHYCVLNTNNLAL